MKRFLCILLGAWSIAAADPTTPARPGKSLFQLAATWTDDAGQPRHLESLRGRPVLISMFYTDCQGACPMIVATLKRIQDALPQEARAQTRIVLVSFDTQRDTPQVLRLYREQMRLGPEWILLTGGSDDVRDLSMVLGVRYERDERGQFAHSNLITVLDRSGAIAAQRSGLTADIGPVVRAAAETAR